MKKTPITVAFGDGIGPEIMQATLQVLSASKALLDIHEVEIGEKVYLHGEKTGIEPSTWETIRKNKAFLKAPITTPQGGGFKSLNVAIRTTLGLYANIRPCVSYHPFVESKYPTMDVVIVRENEEDLYTGIEYQQTPTTFQALKIITRPGCERIIRYAFEYARSNGRKKVTCFTKDNILKLTDGLFHKVFDEIAALYPDIVNEHWIVDIGAAKLADTPENFDVVVMPNLYGDILSDVAAQIAGSVGLAGSANIGPKSAMFEAIHGSAPRRAGQNLANPSGLLLAAVQMLVHIGQPEPATQIHNAWLKTLEDGIHTYDIFTPEMSKVKVGTKEFALAIIERLGQVPTTLKSVHYAMPQKLVEAIPPPSPTKKEVLGMDLFIQSTSPMEELVKKLKGCEEGEIKLVQIFNRGVKVWPGELPEASLSDSWRCRFLSDKPQSHSKIASIVQKASQSLDFTQVELLFSFGKESNFS